MNTTAPTDRMAAARAQKAANDAEKRRLLTLQKEMAQRQLEQPEREEEWSDEPEDIPLPPPKKRREIIVEPYEPEEEPVRRVKKKKNKEPNEPLPASRSWSEHLLAFCYGAFPIAGQLSLLFAGLWVSIAMRTAVEPPKVDYNPPDKVLSYTPPAPVSRSRHPDDYSLF